MGLPPRCWRNIYLHRVDRAWDVREHGVLVRYADDLVVMCHSRQQAEAALAQLTALLAELGLQPKAAKTRIVHLAVGGEGFDFLGFHHRLVRSQGRAGVDAASCSWLAGPAKKAMQHARDRVRELTDRSRLLLPVDWVVRGRQPVPARLGRVLPVRQLRRPVRQDQRVCPDAAGVVHHPPASPQSGVRAGTCSTTVARPAGPGRSHWNRGRTQTLPGLAGKAECRR